MCFPVKNVLSDSIESRAHAHLAKKLALSQPIRSKTKTNRDLLAPVFPRLAPVICICFEF